MTQDPWAEFRTQPAPQQAQPRQADPIIRPADPYRQSAEERARQDQAMQAEQLRLSQEASARAAQGDARAQATFEGTGGTNTEGQAKISTLLTRILGGSRDIAGELQENSDAQSPGLAETVSRGVLGEGMVTRAISGDSRRIVSDAQRDMIDALLTLSTGAAYTPEQVVAQQVAYFPQYGDSEDEIAVKNQRLTRLIEAARVAAGPQWGEIEQAISPLMPRLTGQQGNGGGQGVSQLQGALERGASREEIMAIASQLGLSIDEAALDANLRSRDQGGPVSTFNPPDGSGNGGGGSPAPQPTREGISALILGDGTRSIGQQLGAGVGDIVQGAGDVLGILGNPLNQGINAVFGTNLSTDLGQSARDLSGLPDNPNQMQSAISRGATSAMAFGGAARGLATVAENATTRGVLNTLGQSPIRDAVAGGSAGAGSYVARDAGPIGQTAAALGAGALGYGAAGLLPGVRAATAGAPAANAARRGAQDVIATGEREGVRVMTSDVAPPQNFVSRSVRALGERIPVAGTGGPRAAQQAEREAAVRRVAEEYGVTGSDDFVASVTNDLVRTRGDRLSRLSDRKNRIIDGVTAPVRPTALRRTLREIDQQIATLERTNPSQMAPVVRNLQTFREALQASPTLRQVEENRRLLGDMFADPSLANVKGLGEKAVRAIYGPLREDMIDFVRTEAGDQAAQGLQETNERLASMVGELDARNFSRVLRQADTTPESVANLLFSRNDSDVRRLVENLSPRGRQQAQSAIIYRAVSSAGDLNAVAQLSPQRFANQIERYSSNIGIVFEPEDAARLQGLQRLLQATQRASEASALPPTGVQNSLPILTAVLADVMGGAGAGLTTAGMAGVTARLYESQAARNMLVGLSRSQPGSQRETRTLENLARIMASQPAIREAFTRAANDNATLPANVAASPQDDQR